MVLRLTGRLGRQASLLSRADRGLAPTSSLLSSSSSSFSRRGVYVWAKPKPAPAPVVAEMDEGATYWNKVKGAPVVERVLAREAGNSLPPLVLSHAKGPVPPQPGLAPTAFAVVMVAKRQFKVVPGDELHVASIPDVDVGEVITLDKVLLMGGLKGTVVGQPLIPGASVLAEVQEHGMTKDVIVAHFRRRKGSKRTKLHKQQVTILRIIDIQYKGDDDLLSQV